MSPVKPRSLHSSDKELGAVCIGAGIGHAEQAGLRMLYSELLIFELRPVDRFASRAISSCEVASLYHEFGNDPVEDGAFIVKDSS